MEQNLNLAKPEVILSASTVKSLETCSWLHYAKKVLKFPDPGNSGAFRGSVCHLIFELLHNPRHKKHFNTLKSTQKLSSCPSIDRLVIKHLKKYGIYEPEHYELVEKMIMVGLSIDFYAANGEIKGIEKEFILRSENPKYAVIGYIDVLGWDEKTKTASVRDFKSQKSKFKDDELADNIQAFTYTLAVKKQLIPEAKEVSVKFILLRFPEDPIQEVKVTDTQLTGFEKYLAYMYEIANDFTEDKARRNFAYDNPKNKWLCKAGATWECPARRPKDYFVLIENGKAVKGAFTKEELDKNLKPGQTIESRRYEGCPRHNVCI